MNVTLKQVILLSSLTCGAFFAGKCFFPHIKTVPQVIPEIHTEYDTVQTLPAWFEDSLNYWKKRKFTTDTVPLIIAVDHVDIPAIVIDTPPMLRPDWHPLLALNSNAGKFGDTLFTYTFSLRTGKEAVSKVFIPGYITGIDAQYPNETPRIDFKPFPKAEQHGWFYPIKYTLLGTGIGLLGGFGACIARP